MAFIEQLDAPICIFAYGISAYSLPLYLRYLPRFGCLLCRRVPCLRRVVLELLMTGGVIGADVLGMVVAKLGNVHNEPQPVMKY